MPGATTISFVRPSSVDDCTLEEVTALASRYLDLDPLWFQRCIRDGDRLILYRDRETGRVQGTTTLRILDEEHEGTRVRALYTGGVVLDRSVRGRGLIQRAGILSFLRFGLSTNRRSYWFSECDSFRAYQLSLSFERSWPRPAFEPSDFDRGLYAKLCRKTFGSTWSPETGLCASIPERRLKREVGAIPEGLLRTNPDVAYFAERNPRYLEGEALPVLVPLDISNWWSMARTLAAARWQRALGSRRPEIAAFDGDSR